MIAGRPLDRTDYAKLGTANLKARLANVENLRAEHMEAALQDAFAIQEITAVLAERGEL